MYALIQTGTTIFGTGATETLAKQDALEWLDEIDTLDQLEAALATHNGIDGLEVVRCTPALHEYTQVHGAPDSWELNAAGEICLDDELTA